MKSHELSEETRAFAAYCLDAQARDFDMLLGYEKHMQVRLSLGLLM
jgi:hypothetical protein